jgi:glycosyltransferase involved in cell wall biosynthesis
MRCLIDARVLTDPNPGGVTRVARSLIQELVDQASPEDSFTLVTSGFKKTIHPILDTRYSIPDTRISLPNKLIALSTFLDLTSIDRLYTRYPITASGGTPLQAAVLDTRYSDPDVLFLPNLEMVGRPRLPYALLIHDLSFWLEPRWFSPKSRLWHHVTRARTLIENASALFTVSDHTKQDLLDHFHVNQKNIQTLPIEAPLLPQESAELPPDLKNTQYFLVLGANDPRKNVSCVIQAFQELLTQSNGHEIKLVLIGTPSSDTRYVCISRPSDTLLSTMMRHASALLYPSWYEGFGLPLHEAHALGTPIIASTSGALPETAPPGTLFIPPFKPHLWTQAMHLILKRGEKPSSPISREAASQKAACIILDTLHRIAHKD